MQPEVVFGLANIVTGIVCILVAIPLLKRKIKMNGWYGIRIPKSFASDENWYRINEYGAKQLIVWAIPLMAFGLFCVLLPSTAGKMPMHQLFVGPGPTFLYIVIVVIRAIRYADKL